MKVKKNISIEYAEELNRFFAELETDNDLEIPFSDMSEINFSSFASFIQSYVGWVRSEKKGKLLLRGNIKKMLEKTTNEDFPGTLFTDYNYYKYLFVTSALNWKSAIEYEDPSYKDIVRKHNVAFQENAKNIKCFKGSEILLASFDFDRVLDNRGLISPLYDNNGGLRKQDHFTYNLVPEMLNEVAKRYSTALFKDFEESDFANIGKIIYELYKNTHEWGRHEYDTTTPITPNIRSIYCNLHKSTQTGYIQRANKHSALTEYFCNSKFNAFKDKEFLFLEISVLDSGAGFIRRKLKQDKPNVPPAIQVEIIKECLTKYHTTSQTLFAEHKGKGLDSVLRSLDGRGFLRIRTENVCVYRDLIKNKYVTVDDTKEMHLNDWETNDTESFTNFPTTHGAVISMFYPLNITGNE